jgi:hypothetical protein
MTFEEIKTVLEETARLQKENALGLEKLKEQVNKVSKQLGGIDENIGHHAEEFFQNAFAENLVFGGIKYNEMIPNMSHREKNGEVEFDIVLENGNSVALIEVKNRVHPKFVREFAEDRIKKLRAFFPKYRKYKAYLGIAGFSFSKTVLEEAKKHGIGLVRQSGKSIEVAAGKLRAY